MTPTLSCDSGIVVAEKHLNLLHCDCAALLSERSSLVVQARSLQFSAQFELLKRHLRLAEWPVAIKRCRSQGLAADRLPDRNHTQMVGYEGAAQGHRIGELRAQARLLI